jgi:glycosyltransferase involved in cell wall biosynthesis
MLRNSIEPVETGKAVTSELVVVIPAYNEETNIERVLRQWEKTLLKYTNHFQFVIVNDGSKDNTRYILDKLAEKQPNRFIVIHKSNSGHGSSCRIGYDIACASSADWVLQIDSDGQCDPAFFESFWVIRNDADCVFGERKSRDDGFGRTITTKCCSYLSSHICGTRLRDPNVPYRLMRRSVLSAALGFIPPTFNMHNVAITFVLSRTKGVRWQHFPIHFPNRKGGSNSVNLMQVCLLGLDMLLELWKLKKKLNTGKSAVFSAGDSVDP